MPLAYCYCAPPQPRCDVAQQLLYSLVRARQEVPSIGNGKVALGGEGPQAFGSVLPPTYENFSLCEFLVLTTPSLRYRVTDV